MPHPLRSQGIAQYKDSAPTKLTPQEQLVQWRVDRLTSSWRKNYDVAFTSEEMESLCKVAAGHGDLHQACAALEAGCDPLTLERIFV